MSEVNKWLKQFVGVVTYGVTLIILLLLVDQAAARVTEHEPVFYIRIERN